MIEENLAEAACAAAHFQYVHSRQSIFGPGGFGKETFLALLRVLIVAIDLCLLEFIPLKTEIIRVVAILYDPYGAIDDGK